MRAKINLEANLKANLAAGTIAAFLIFCGCNSPAYAITAEIARACDALVAKTFPPRQVGNPAAGSAKGSAKEQRDYFSKCVANGGKMDDAKDSK